MLKERIDALLVERGLAVNRSHAQRLVMAGQVRVNGQLVIKPGMQIATDADISVEKGVRFVSRGGEKLEAALAEFGLDVAGACCADVGASTGGFTDCLLQRGARKVYAIDVGKGILHWKHRLDERVVVMEETNARYLQKLPEKINLVVVDVSFISVKLLFPVIKGWFPAQGGNLVVLIKPQFEASRQEASQGRGVIRDAQIHKRILLEVLTNALDNGYGIGGLTRSPLRGPKGNVEFLAWLVYPGLCETDLRMLVDNACHQD